MIRFEDIRGPKNSTHANFEELVSQLLFRENSAEPREGRGGDGGIDAFLILKDGKRKVYQAKYYCNTLRPHQKRAIEKSLARALETTQVAYWALCIPKNRTAAEERWFSTLARPSLELDWIGETKLREMLVRHQDLCAEFFPSRPQVLLRQISKKLTRLELLATNKRSPSPQAGSKLQGPSPSVIRGLLPFVESDAKSFFGRDREARQLALLVQHSDFKIGTLYGHSGCGKSSLLRAGLSPRVRAAGLVPIYAKCRGNLNDLKDSIMHTLAEIAPLTPGPIALGRLLRHAQEYIKGPILLLCDQAEDLLSQAEFDSAVHEEFEDLLLHVQGSTELRLLLCVRSDSFYLTGRYLSPFLNHPFASNRTQELRRLKKPQVSEILHRANQHNRMCLSRHVILTLAKDLLADGPVLPTELQIVLSELSRQGIQSKEEYEAAGKREGLMGLFLEQVLAASGDRDLATGILLVFANNHAANTQFSASDVADRLGIDLQDTANIVSLMEQERILWKPDGKDRFELIHQYLIPRIREVAGQSLSKQKRARDLLSQSLSAHRISPGTLIPLTSLFYIWRHGGDSVSWNDEERKLFAKSRTSALKTASGIILTTAFLLASATLYLSYSEEWRSEVLWQGHEHPVSSMARVGVQHLVSGDRAGNLFVWDIEERTRTQVLRPHDGASVDAIAISRDNLKIVSGSRSGSLLIGDLSDGLIKISQNCSIDEPIFDLEFSPDGSKIAITTSTGPVYLLDSADCSKQTEVVTEDKGGREPTVAYSPKGRYFFTTAGDVFSETGQKTELSLPWLGSGEMDYSEELGILVNADSQGRVKIVDVSGLWKNPVDKAVTLMDRRGVHKDFAQSTVVSGELKLAATAAEDIILWDLGGRNDLSFPILSRLPFKSHPRALVFREYDTSLFAGYRDGSIVIWDVATKSIRDNLSGHGARVGAIRFSSDGSIVASGDDNGVVVLWDSKSRRAIKSAQEHKGSVVGLEFIDLNGRDHLVSLDRDCSIQLWDFEAGTSPEALQKHDDNRRCNVVATSGYTDSIAFSRGVLSVDSPELIMDFSDLCIPHSYVYGVDFFEDGMEIVVAEAGQGGSAGSIFAISLKTGRIIRQVHRNELSGSAVSLRRISDREFVVGTDTGFIEVWAMDPLRLLRTFGLGPEGEGGVRALGHSADGQLVLGTGSGARIWRADRGAMVAEIGADVPEILSGDLSHDGSMVAVGSNDQSVRIYYRSRKLAAWQFN